MEGSAVRRSDSLTRSLAPSEKRRKKWQIQLLQQRQLSNKKGNPNSDPKNKIPLEKQLRGLSLEEDGTHSWPVSTRTRIFLPYFTWDPQKTKSSQIQSDELIGTGKFSKVFRTRLDNFQNCSALDDSSRDTTDGPATNKGGSPEIGDSVAVKVMDKSVILSHPGVANQLNQETRIHQVCCHHPNVLNMMKAWQDERHLYMAFDFCPQGTLGDLIRQNSKCKSTTLHEDISFPSGQTEQENGLVNSTPTCDNVKLSYSDLTAEENQGISSDIKLKIEATHESSEESSSDVWLGKSVSENRVPEMAVIKAGHQLVSALNYIHDIGVIHRDVKPDNILVGGSGKKLLLTDFGLSMWLGKRQKTTSVCGTLPFMAPEVLASSVEHPYGHSADFWSLGVTLYTFAKNGELPFDRAQDHLAMLTNVKSNYESVISRLDKSDDAMNDLSSIIVQLLEFDGNKREGRRLLSRLEGLLKESQKALLT